MNALCRWTSLASFVAVAFASSNKTLAQCLQWRGLTGGELNGAPLALTVFDDGGGPALYAGGGISAAGGIAVNNIAKWNGSAWAPLGAGVNSFVRALVVFDDGTGPALYVGGDFSIAGGAAASRIAKWDGSTWSPLGSGTNNRVFALAVFDDGSGPALYAGGSFTTAGGGTVNHVAKWNGATWAPLGTGVNGEVYALAAVDLGSGSALYVGGEETFGGIAKWNGANWSELHKGVTAGYVTSLTGLNDGSGPSLFVGGQFNVLAGPDAENFARWNGSTWFQTSNFTQPVLALTVFDEGFGPDIYLGGSFAGGIRRWSGATLSSMGTGVSSGDVLAFATFDDGSGNGPDLFVGGSFTSAGSQPIHYLAKWSGCGSPMHSFCAGDGHDQFVSPSCACAFFGDPGNGCGNSAYITGARLTATGTTTPDTVDLTAVDMPPGTGSIFLQGSSVINAGVAFGDGVRCVAGQLIRLAVKLDTDLDSSTSFGPSFGDPQISDAGSTSAATTYYYQAYYRDANPTWCTPATFNITNGVVITWL